LSKSPHDLVEFQVGEAIDPIVGELGTSPTTKSFPSTPTTSNVSPPNFEPPTLTLINDHEPNTKTNTRVESSFSFVSSFNDISFLPPEDEDKACSNESSNEQLNAHQSQSNTSIANDYNCDLSALSFATNTSLVVQRSNIRDDKIKLGKGKHYSSSVKSTVNDPSSANNSNFEYNTYENKTTTEASNVADFHCLARVLVVVNVEFATPSIIEQGKGAGAPSIGDGSSANISPKIEDHLAVSHEEQDSFYEPLAINPTTTVQTSTGFPHREQAISYGGFGKLPCTRY
jgi:hypothetical protein